MPVSSEWTLDYTNRIVRHTDGQTGLYSVNTWFSWIQDEIDELGTIDDDEPMSADNQLFYKVGVISPSATHPWFVDPEHLAFLTGDNSGTKDGGSIETLGWSGFIHMVAFASSAGAVATDIGKAVTDDAAGVGTLVGFNDAGTEWYIRTTTSQAGAFIASGSVMAITDGTGSGTSNANSVTGECLWTNVFTAGSDAVISSIQPYIGQNGAVVYTAPSGGHIDILVAAKLWGTVIDSGDITVFARDMGYTFYFYELNIAGGGRQVAPLSVANDDADDGTTGAGTGNGNDITVGFAGYTADVDDNASNENYDYQVDCESNTLSYVYQRLKYHQRRGSTFDFNGVDGHLYKSAGGAYAVVQNGPFASIAGGKLFGARGILFISMDAGDANNYELIDADGNTGIAPPTTVSVGVTAVVSGDRVAIFKLTGAGGDLDRTQYSIDGAHSIGGGTVTVKEALDADTPSAGTIRLGNDGVRYAYASWSGKVFTLSGTLAENYSDDDDAFVPYLDLQATTTAESISLKYSTDRNVLVRVRKKGIKPFEVESTIISTGLSVAAIRTTDGVVT